MPPPPLRSGMECSDPGNDCPADRDRAGIVRAAPDGGMVFAALGGEAMVLRGRYSAFDGDVANGPYLRFGLCLSSSANLAQQIDGIRLEGRWQPGSVVVTPAGGHGLSRCSPVDMIGLAVLPSLPGDAAGPDALDPEALAGRFHHDPLLAAVIDALYCEAEIHGASTAFFEHGVALILRRLAELRLSPPRRGDPRPLSPARLARVRDYVEARLADDIPVADMAAVAGMDPSGFTRALRARTGLPPYAWLTRRRMERAAELLTAGWRVTRVAHALGYANSGKFAAAFRRVTGASPSMWQARRQG